MNEFQARRVIAGSNAVIAKTYVSRAEYSSSWATRGNAVVADVIARAVSPV